MKSLKEYMVNESNNRVKYHPVFTVTTNMKSSAQSSDFGFVTADIRGDWTLIGEVDGEELGRTTISFECKIQREDCTFTKFDVSDMKLLKVLWRVMGWDEISRLATDEMLKDAKFSKEVREAVEIAFFRGFNNVTPGETLRK